MVALFIFVFKIFSCSFARSFVCRIDGKSSIPEQKFGKMEEHAKETSAVVSALYLKVLTEDLTSEGK